MTSPIVLHFGASALKTSPCCAFVTIYIYKNEASLSRIRVLPSGADDIIWNQNLSSSEQAVKAALSWAHILPETIEGEASKFILETFRLHENQSGKSSEGWAHPLISLYRINSPPVGH